MEYSNIEITYLNGLVATYILKTSIKLPKEDMDYFLASPWIGLETKNQYVAIRTSEIRTMTYFNGELWKPLPA